MFRITSGKIILFATMMLPCLAQAQQSSPRVDKTLTIYTDVMRELDMNYVDTLNYEDLVETSINQMLRKIDPYTVYYPKSKDTELKMMTTGKYGGIGSIIQQREVEGKKGEKLKQTYIANPYAGKPAQKAGVLAGDKLLEVDGVSTKGKAVADVSQMLRGVPGTTVSLKLEREGLNKPFVIEFAREEIHMDAVDYYNVLPHSRVGYISLREFTTGSASEFSKALDELVYQRGIESLLIDLRDNGGGIVDEAIQIVNLFIGADTEIVSTKGKTALSCHSFKTHAPARFPDMPVMILVNKNSASASEIVSGSMQDLGRARLIGERTYGKGLVQNLRPIAYDGHLKVTTSKYYLPSGRCIQAIDYAERQRGKELKKDTAGGILPDIVLSDSAKLDISYSLYVKNMFFDYATRYHRLHPSIATPDTFALTDDDIEDFCRFLEEKQFTYETETSKYIHEVIEMAKNEDIDSLTLATLRDIEVQLKPSYRDAIARNQETIKQMLGAEIIERYYYQKGRAEFMLRSDKAVSRALEELRREVSDRDVNGSADSVSNE